MKSFRTEPVTDATLHALYDLLKLGPTAFNAQPGRYLFLRSAEAKQRLAPAMASGNRQKTVAAPVTVLVAYDTLFFQHLPGPAAASRGKEIFAADPELAASTALRNSSLQGAYLMLAARALGLGVGPMSGFNADLVNREFFPDSPHRVNFIVNLGYPDGNAVLPARGQRFAFEDVARII